MTEPTDQQLPVDPHEGIDAAARESGCPRTGAEPDPTAVARQWRGPHPTMRRRPRCPRRRPAPTSPARSGRSPGGHQRQSPPRRAPRPRRGAPRRRRGCDYAAGAGRPSAGSRSTPAAAGVDQILGLLSHATGESIATMNQYGADRLFPVPASVDPSGKRHTTAHFRLAKIGMVSPRLYYPDDVASSGTVYIGYIGRHLRNIQTN